MSRLRYTPVLRQAWDTFLERVKATKVPLSAPEKRRGSAKGPRYFFVPIPGGHRAILNPARLNKYGSDRSYKR